MEKNVLTLAKQFETEHHPIPTITYRVSSHAEKPFRLRIKEELPDALQVTDLRFHSGDADDWLVTDRMAVFERRIDAGAEVSTLVGVPADDAETLAAFDARPAVDVAPDGGTSDADPNWVTVSADQFEFRSDVPAEPTAATNVLASDGGRVSSTDEPTESAGPDAAGESDNSLESAIPSTTDLEGGSDVDRSPADSERGASREAAETTSDSTLVDEFVTALRTESLSEEQREALRAELGLESVGSLHARVEHCQTRLSDLAAYTDALEAFLDEDGSAKQLIEDFRSDLAAVEERVATVESEVSSTAARQEELAERLTDLEAEMAGLDEVEQSVETLQTRLDRSTGTLADDLESLRATVDELEEWQGTVTGAFAGAETGDGE